MSEIYAPPGQEPVWPASINSVQLQQDYPNTHFTPLMTAEEKAEFNLFQVQPTDPPEINPAENRLEGPIPVFVDEQWVERWLIVPLSEEEKEAYYRSVNPPKWNSFAALLMQEPRVTLFLKEVVSQDPASFGGFIGGLAQASSNGPGFFVFTWQKVSAQGLIPPELREFVIEAAEQSDLPADFLQIL